MFSWRAFRACLFYIRQIKNAQPASIIQLKANKRSITPISIELFMYQASNHTVWVQSNLCSHLHRY